MDSIETTTFFDCRPTHRPMTRRQALLHDADVLDIQRCVVVDTDPALAAEMWEAYKIVTDYAATLCDHDNWFTSANGHGDDMLIIHECVQCGRIMAIE